MNSSHPELIEHLVDGQPTIIPTEVGWAKLVNDPVLDGVPLYLQGMKKLFEKNLDFVASHKEEFSLGLYRYGKIASWMAVPLLRMENKFQRVQIEKLNCKHCNWSGITANPCEGSLFYWADRNDAELEAINIPRVCCPRCNEALPRPAIWVESISTN